MINRLKILAKYGAFWILYFVLMKLFFLVFNRNFATELSIKDYFSIFYHGFALDISIVSYILLLPSLILTLLVFVKTKLLSVFFNFYTVLLLLLTTFLSIIDIALYGHWGFRLDITPLLYMDNLEAFTASLPLLQALLLLLLTIGFSFLFYFLYKKTIYTSLLKLEKAHALHSLTFLLITASLIIPIRGGLGEIPIKVSSVYFHKVTYANHASINGIWNFMYSYTKKDLVNAKVSFMENALAEELFKNLTQDTTKTTKILNTTRPNILIIALESLSSKIIEHPGATPYLRKLISEQVYFSNFFASGDRTDRAMVAILSAYPSFPSRNIMSFPQKTESLPFLSKDLKQLGYTNNFYYGGSLNFANYRGFLTNGQFDKLISIDDFESKDLNSKWGAHDHVVFDKLLHDMEEKQTKPFFTFLFTSSSHEPFDVPMETVITGSSQDSMFLNAAYYADKSLEQFVAKASKTTWWENTWVIVVADHGTIIPFNTPNYAEEKFRIPMIFMGGALDIKDTVIPKYGTHSDIPKTILSQLGVVSNQYTYSNNLFSEKEKGTAFYAFNNGFGFFSDSLTLIYDNNADRYILQEGVTDSLQLNYGKAYLQILSNDFQKR